LGRIYQLVNKNKERKDRAISLFKALAVLRGGAKQAQFGTDIAPKVLLLAGLNCGNPIFNHLFADDSDGPVFKIETFKEVIRDYADRIATPVLLGIRAGYLRNDKDVRNLAGWYQVSKAQDSSSATKLDGPHSQKQEKEPGKEQWIEVKVITPIEASRTIEDLLP
jgi:CRISPR/Cas system-associated protein Cas7 (RAMP superfamily)